MSDTWFKWGVVLIFAAVLFMLIDGCTATPTRTFPATVHSRQYHSDYWYMTTYTDANHQVHMQMHHVPERWTVYLVSDGWSGSLEVGRDTFERLRDGGAVDVQVVKGGLTGVEGVRGIAAIHPNGN